MDESEVNKEESFPTEPQVSSSVPSSNGPEGEAQNDLEEEKGDPAVNVLAEKEQQYKELYDRYMRATADFDNYKKRIMKEQMDLAKYSSEKLLREILPILDNLERALAHSKETQDVPKLLEGIVLIQKQFLDVLSKFGVTVLESFGQPFDPYHHQAISQVEEEKAVDNQVIGEIQKGYLLHDRLLRPAMVVVSKRKEPSLETDSEGPECNPENNVSEKNLVGSEEKKKEGQDG